MSRVKRNYAPRDASFFAKNCVSSRGMKESWAQAKKRGGIRYAKAIAAAENIGLKVIWDQDTDCNYSDFDDEGETQFRLENGELESLYAVAVLPKEGYEDDPDWENDSRKREMLASLGCITVKAPSFIRGRPQDPYIRCVEAELIEESLDEAKGIVKQRLPRQKEILGAAAKPRRQHFSSLPVGKCFRWAGDAQGDNTPYRYRKIAPQRYQGFTQMVNGGWRHRRDFTPERYDTSPDLSVVVKPCPPREQKDILGAARKGLLKICDFDQQLVDEQGNLAFVDRPRTTWDTIRETFIPASKHNRAQTALSHYLYALSSRDYATREDELIQVVPGGPRTDKERRDFESGHIVAKPLPGMKQVGTEFWQRPHPLRKRKIADAEADARKTGCRFAVEQAKLCKLPPPPPWVVACAEAKLSSKYPFTRREARRLRMDKEPRQKPILGRARCRRQGGGR